MSGSFEALVVCVDSSGSMSGDKLKNAKNSITQMVASFNCTTKYYKFDNELHPMTKQDFEKLSASGGTRIENAINKLYDTELPSLSQSKTKLLFVTDAQDHISDPSACKSKKHRCEQKFAKGLAGEALLVGSSGSCASVLKDIFGANSFHSCSNSKFKEQLGDITESAEVTNKINGDVPKQKKDTKQAIEINKNNLQQTQTTVNDQKKKADTVEKDANNVTNDVTKHHQTLPNKLSGHNAKQKELSSKVNKAATEDEKDDAEDETEDQLTNVKKDKYKLMENGKKLKDETVKVQEGAKEVKKTAKKAQKDTKTFAKSTEAVVSKITAQCKELNTLKVGSKDEIQKAKKDFSEMLDNLENQVGENFTLAMEIDELKKKFGKTLRALKRGKIQNDEYKKKIKEHEDKLKALLNQINQS